MRGETETGSAAAEMEGADGNVTEAVAAAGREVPDGNVDASNWLAEMYGRARAIVLFDGECSFCNGAVQFLYKRDPAGNLRYASLQSETARRLLEQAGAHVQSAPDSFVLLPRDGKVYWRSDAALRTARLMGGAWPLAYVFVAVPRRVRDGAYDWFARRRHRWFGGKEQACAMPTPELRARLLQDK